MKTATIPSLRVTPDVRAAAESVLEEGETLSAFAESALLKQIESRQHQQAFIARGLAAKTESDDSGRYISATESLARLDGILDKYRDGS